MNLPPAPSRIDVQTVMDRTGAATVEVYPQIGSTMERAREIADDMSTALPAVVLADVQTAGHGRRGARWWQAPGSFAASIVVDQASTGAAPRPTWSLACGVSLAEALAALEPGLSPLVRWPNDLEVDGRKLAGILLEMASGGRTILGIGVNTTGSVRDAPEPIRGRLTTVPDLIGRSMASESLLIEFVPRFLWLVRAIDTDPAALVDHYRLRCSLEGRDVTVFRGDERVQGVCRGIGVDGGLLIDTASGRVSVVSGSLTDPSDVWR